MKPEVNLIEIRKTEDGYHLTESVKTTIEKKTGDEVTVEEQTDQRFHDFESWEDLLLYLSEDDNSEEVVVEDAPAEEVEK